MFEQRCTIRYPMAGRSTTVRGRCRQGGPLRAIRSSRGDARRPTERGPALLRASYTNGNSIHGCDNWPKSDDRLVDRQIGRNLYFAEQGWRSQAIGTGIQVCSEMARTVVERASVLPHAAPYSPLTPRVAPNRRLIQNSLVPTLGTPVVILSHPVETGDRHPPHVWSSMKSPDDWPALISRGRSETS